LREAQSIASLFFIRSNPFHPFKSHHRSLGLSGKAMLVAKGPSWTAARAHHNNLENDWTDKTDMNGFMTQW